jgi:hypothetical protein
VLLFDVSFELVCSFEGGVWAIKGAFG